MCSVSITYSILSDIFNPNAKFNDFEVELIYSIDRTSLILDLNKRVLSFMWNELLVMPNFCNLNIFSCSKFES